MHCTTHALRSSWEDVRVGAKVVPREPVLTTTTLTRAKIQMRITQQPFGFRGNVEM
jgi:hypothetical protein